MSRRSIVLGGTTTSVFLEDEFWKEIDNRSKTQGAQWYELVREMLEGIEDPKNRSSAIKETIIRTLRDECDKARQSAIELELEVDTNGQKYTYQQYGVRHLIGRDPECNIEITETGASRRHAMVVHDSSKWWLLDLDSKNGTKLNNKKTKASLLESGDVIKIGKSVIKVL